MQVTNLRRTWISLGLVLVALGGCFQTATALAAKKRPVRTVTATVNGKHIRWRGRLVLFNYDTAIGLRVIGTKILATKTIGVGCPILFSAYTYPFTMTVCDATFQTRRGRHSSFWTNLNTMQVTFNSFDGTNVTGTFSGTLDPLAGTTEGSLAIEGTFSGPLGP